MTKKPRRAAFSLVLVSTLIALLCASSSSAVDGYRSECLPNSWSLSQAGSEVKDGLNNEKPKVTLTEDDPTILRRATSRERFEEERKQQKEREAKRKAERDIKNQELLAKAKDNLAKAESAKQQNPGAYLRALLRMSSAYGRIEDLDSRRRSEEEALKVFSESTDALDPSDVDDFFRSWRFEGPLGDRNNTVSSFEKILPIALQVPSNESGRNWHRAALYALDRASRSDYQKKISLLELWLSLTAKNRSKGLDRTLNMQLASAYEHSGAIEKATAIHKQMIAKTEPGSRDSIYEQLNFSQYLARNKLMSESVRAWQTVGKQVNWQFPPRTALTFKSIIDSYDRNGAISEKALLIDTLLVHPNGEILELLDEPLRKQLAAYVNTATLDKAEALLRKRVEAGKMMTNPDPGSYWTLTLSDVYLANGKTQQSNKLFDEILKSMSLSGLDTTTTKENRSALIRRLREGGPSTAIKVGPAPSRSKRSINNSTGAAVLAPGFKTEISPDIKSVSFDYVLFARSKIDLSGNLSIGSINSSEPTRRTFSGGKQGNIYCPGSLRLDGNLSVDGTIYGDPKINPTFKLITPITTPITKLPAAFTSATAIEIPEYGASFENGGDFKTSNFKSSNYKKQNVVTRIFLYDAFNAGTVAATLNSANNRGNPANFQIWYNGTRRIVIPHNSEVNAIIYAPNAEVYMPSNNHRFVGAIVANTIVGEGNFRIDYDEALRGHVFNP